MELVLIECILGLVILLFGWVHVRQNRLEDKIEHCIEKDAFEEVKADLKEALRLLTDERVENAEWRGQMKRVLEIKQEKS